MTDDRYKCIICNKEKITLISVISNMDAGSCFVYNRGICQDCLLHGNLDKICRETQLKKAEETIKQIKDNLKFWENAKERMEEGK